MMGKILIPIGRKCSWLRGEKQGWGVGAGGSLDLGGRIARGRFVFIRSVLFGASGEVALDVLFYASTVWRCARYRFSILFPFCLYT